VPESLTLTGSVRVEPFGDSAVLITVGDTIDPLVNQRVHAVARQLDAMPKGERVFAFETSVPAYSSLLVPFDRWAVSAHEAAQYLEGLIEELDLPSAMPDLPSRLVEIHVRYGGHGGPDLLEVAERTSLTPEQVVEAHASVDYACFFLGFAPGFGYLGVLPQALDLPRRHEPRSRVPAGSVAIAGRQTAVYPSPTPGGWHLIGHTEAVLWDVHRDPPALLAAGCRVRFVPVRG